MPDDAPVISAVPLDAGVLDTGVSDTGDSDICVIAFFLLLPRPLPFAWEESYDELPPA
jgi:hypothetical protein